MLITCPNCNHAHEVDAAAKLGAAGGKKSRRKITPEQQRIMQAARNLAIIKRNREGRGHEM